MIDQTHSRSPGDVKMLRAILENSAGDGKYLVDVASSTAGGETEFGLSSRQVHQFIAANAAKSNYQGPKWAKIGEVSQYSSILTLS